MGDLLEKLEIISELLYQERIKAANELLQSILISLAKHIETIEDVQKQQDMLISLNEALKAMEQEEYTLFADIIHHEIVSKLKVVAGEGNIYADLG